MTKLLSIAAVALMMAGSTAFACSGCGCEAKKTDKDKKEKTECGSCKGEEKKTACGETKKEEKAQHDALACHHNKDKDKTKETSA